MRLLSVLAAAVVAGASGSALAVDGDVLGNNSWVYNVSRDTYVRSDVARHAGGVATYTNINANLQVTRNRGSAPLPQQWIMGDDLNQTAAGNLTEVTFSVWNGNTAAGGGAINVPANEVQVVLRFWANTGVTPDFNVAPPIASLTVSLPALNSGFGGNFTLTGLGSLFISLPQNVFAGLHFQDNATLPGNFATAAANYGQIITAAAPTVGTSADAFFRDRNDDPGVTAPAIQFFGGNPVANFQWELKTVPTPGAAALAGVAGLAALRRRRA